MPPSPEIALLISSYQRPGHLRRALLSVSLQRGVGCGIEVVVTDDGSTDETPEVVRQFARTAGFPVHFTTHPHKAFQLARCRNEGVAASTAPYLLFLDGDCVLPPDHVAIHLRRRRRGFVMSGDCVRLDEQTSARVDEAAIRGGEFVHWAPVEEIDRLKRQIRKAAWRPLRWRPRKPELTGNNVGVWRSDYVRVNGYDENFVGWGAEDNDLGYRLHRAGVRIRSILAWTRTFHLWHPREVTCPPTAREGQNYPYFMRRGGLVRCRNGLVKRPLEDLNLRVVGAPATATLRRLIPLTVPLARANAKVAPEVEIVFSPGAGKFSGQADCNILVALEDTPAARRLAHRAHIVVADRELPDVTANRSFRLHEFELALRSVA